MYLAYKYTGIVPTSRRRYPFMRQTATFYANKLSVNGSGQ